MFGLQDETVRKGVISGMISSVVIIVIFQPVFNFLSPKLLVLISNSYSLLSNMIYMTAAKGITYSSSSALLNVISGCTLGFGLSILSRPFKNSHLINRKNDKVMALFMIIMSLILIGQVFSERMTIRLNTSFQQRITILSPYISQSEAEMVKSKWASMQSVSDYELINKLLTDYANKHKVKLPQKY